MAIPVAPGGPPGGLVATSGQVQYGDMLLGAGTSAGWRELVGWRDLPSAQSSDTERPQAHGAYAGDVVGDALTVTFTYLVRGVKGDPEAKLRHLQTIEANTRMDGVERPLVVRDAIDTSVRMARVIGRQVPMDKAYDIAPVECSVQFLCADPRRYSLDVHSGSVMLPVSVGGLVYPQTFPLSYGTSSSGRLVATNAGGEATPLFLQFVGPLTDPVVSCLDWSLGFNITLADGETLDVDTLEGTALLDGTADRLYTIRNDSDPLDRCTLRPGATTLTLTAPGGTGRLSVSWRDARM